MADDSGLRVEKITVLGAGGVGKSALTIRLVHNKWTANYDPTIEDSYRTNVEVDNERVTLEILDTAGQEEFSSLHENWMRDGKGFVLVFSVDSRSTFDSIHMFHQKILRTKEDVDKVPMVLVGNKCDLPDELRQVSRADAEQVASSFGCPYIETSAKMEINNREPFLQVVREIRRCEPKPLTKKPRRLCHIL